MLRRLTRSIITNLEYFENNRLASRSKVFHKAELSVADFRQDNEKKQIKRLVLYSVPPRDVEPIEGPYFDALKEFNVDTVFVQEDPMTFISNHRKVTKRIAKVKEDTFTANSAIPNDYPSPTIADETFLNIIQLRLIKQQPKEEGIPDGTKASSEELLNEMREDLEEYVFGETVHYPYMSRVVLSSLIDKETIVLGDMPEQLLRMKLANTLTLQDLYEIRDRSIEELNRHYSANPTHMVSLREVVLRHYSHLISAPRDLYITSILKEACKNTEGIVAFVGAPHFYPILRLWREYTPFHEATKVPPKMQSDTPEILIEKHAILDFLLETEAWNEYYTVNPFPYIGQIDEIKKQMTYFKAYFLKMYKRHVSYADEHVKVSDEVTEELTRLFDRESDKVDADDYEFDAFLEHKTEPY
mmetsp:Transcript_27584/g.49737  ORF Transcript_27584/g.49737 Transcript_27584/m.49737 type:complete len:414 (+) Transcript_27584:32-1273(+)